jgi:hypothetical protein
MNEWRRALHFVLSFTPPLLLNHLSYDTGAYRASTFANREAKLFLHRDR